MKIPFFHFCLGLAVSWDSYPPVAVLGFPAPYLQEQAVPLSLRIGSLGRTWDRTLSLDSDPQIGHTPKEFHGCMLLLCKQHKARGRFFKELLLSAWRLYGNMKVSRKKT